MNRTDLTNRVFFGAISVLVLALGVYPRTTHALGSKSEHKVGFGVTTGFPQLLSAEVRITALEHWEFGGGVGGFPVNSLAHSLYAYPPVPVDLQTTDQFNLYPSGTYTLSGFHGFARWFPGEYGFFAQMGLSTLVFTAQINGTLKNETLGTSVPGAISGSVTLTQPMLDLGPGYQFALGDHFHLDLGLELLVLLRASSNVNVGGSLSNFAVLNAAASANYDAAKNGIANAVNQAMSTYQANVKVLPGLYFTVGYLF